MRFNSTGSQLLVVTSQGSVMLFNKGAALHHWENNHTSNWGGEDILFVDFFHMGVKVQFFIYLSDYWFVSTDFI